MILVLASLAFLCASGLLRRGMPTVFLTLSFSFAFIILSFNLEELSVLFFKLPNWVELFPAITLAISVGCFLRVALLISEFVGSWAGDLIFATSILGHGRELEARRHHSANFSAASSQSLRYVLFLYAISLVTSRSSWLLAVAMTVKKIGLLGGKIDQPFASCLPSLVNLGAHIALLIILPALLVALATDILLSVLNRISPFLLTVDIAVCIKGALVLITLSYAYYLSGEQVGSLIDVICSKIAWRGNG